MYVNYPLINNTTLLSLIYFEFTAAHFLYRMVGWFLGVENALQSCGTVYCSSSKLTVTVFSKRKMNKKKKTCKFTSGLGSLVDELGFTLIIKQAHPCSTASY